MPFLAFLHSSLLHSRAAEGCISIKSLRAANHPRGERNFRREKLSTNSLNFPSSPPRPWQALKVESGYICLLVVIFLISIIPLCYTIAWCFSRNVKLKAANGVSDIVLARPGEAVYHDEGKTKLDKYHCRKRILVFVLQCFIVLSM